jgi:hypothetical protein
MTRGEKKRILREATRQRIQAERKLALSSLPEPMRQGRIDLQGRVEEDQAIRRFSAVPTVFAFAEKIDPRYVRPTWAGHRYGAK